MPSFLLKFLELPFASIEKHNPTNGRIAYLVRPNHDLYHLKHKRIFDTEQPAKDDSTLDSITR